LGHYAIKKNINMKAREILLNLDRLSAGYSSNLLFDKLSLTVCKGEFVCLMGPNGIGKSTLIRTIAGLQDSLEGTVTIGGHARAADKVSVVLTDRITPQNMTVYELISLGRYPYLNWAIRLSPLDEIIIQRALDQVHLHDLKDRNVFELSDGQLQLVMIARALAQDTPLVILDEPTAHLDLNNRLEIMKLLRNIAHQNDKGILVSTHDLDLALQTADTVWVTGHDRNIITGIPEDLVLNNTFDAIFQFKGFDLKTGKVQHDTAGAQSFSVVGEGYHLLWTKNALERNGFNVDTAGSSIITIENDGGNVSWTINQQRFQSLQALLDNIRAL
jgi:iron complex transport system ATP-binding protein